MDQWNILLQSQFLTLEYLLLHNRINRDRCVIAEICHSPCKNVGNIKILNVKLDMRACDLLLSCCSARAHTVEGQLY